MSKNYCAFTTCQDDIYLNEIDFYEDDIVKSYVSKIKTCKTRKELSDHIYNYKGLIPDAWSIINSISDEDLKWVMENWSAASDENHPEINKMINLFGNVLMPSIMIDATLLTQYFGVPFGTAIQQGVFAGRYILRDGSLYLNPKIFK